jgi:hypothetical protein
MPLDLAHPLGGLTAPRSRVQAGYACLPCQEPSKQQRLPGASDARASPALSGGKGHVAKLTTEGPVVLHGRAELLSVRVVAMPG